MQYVHVSILQYILAQNLKLHVTYAERILFQTTLVKVGKGISSQGHGPREGYVGEQALLCQCVLSDLKKRPLWQTQYLEILPWCLSKWSETWIFNAYESLEDNI